MNTEVVNLNTASVLKSVMLYCNLQFLSHNHEAANSDRQSGAVTLRQLVISPTCHFVNTQSIFLMRLEIGWVNGLILDLVNH